MIVSVFLDPDDLRFTQDHLIAADGSLKGVKDAKALPRKHTKTDMSVAEKEPWRPEIGRSPSPGRLPLALVRVTQ